MTRNEAQQLAQAIGRTGAWNSFVAGADDHAVLTIVDPFSLESKRIVEVQDANALLGYDARTMFRDITSDRNQSEVDADSAVKILTPDAEWQQLELAL